MSDIDYDLVGTLRVWAEDANQQGVERVVKGLSEAADEIERLRAELAAAIKERDEARELYCRQIAYDLFRTTGVFDPQQVAIKRGWVGLFKANEPAPRDKEGGGA